MSMLYRNCAFEEKEGEGGVHTSISLEKDACNISFWYIIYACVVKCANLPAFRAATDMNVIGVRKMLKLAREIKNLKCFLHISTAYAHTNRFFFSTFYYYYYYYCYYYYYYYCYYYYYYYYYSYYY